VLLEGRVLVVKRDADGRDQTIAEVGPGGVLGEMSLLHEQPRSATVRAAQPLRVFAMDRGTFLEMVEDGDPAALKMGFAIARVLAGRVAALNLKIVDLLARVPAEPIVELAEYRSKLLTRWDF
jgi:CRP-like cAMP-binding protein